MGSVLPEAVQSGARRFIRVGACGRTQSVVDVGDIGIALGAVRLDGASKNWAPIEYPAISDFRVTRALRDAARGLELPYHVGIEATTDCPNEGRPDINEYVPVRLQEQHEELVARGVLMYSMETATLFVWCTTHGIAHEGYWAGAVNVFSAKHEPPVISEDNAAFVALEAVTILNSRYPL